MAIVGSFWGWPLRCATLIVRVVRQRVENKRRIPEHGLWLGGADISRQPERERGQDNR